MDRHNLLLAAVVGAVALCLEVGAQDGGCTVEDTDGDSWDLSEIGCAPLLEASSTLPLFTG
jgi:hypothetical protein